MSIVTTFKEQNKNDTTNNTDTKNRQQVIFFYFSTSDFKTMSSDGIKKSCQKIATFKKE